jgi:FkbM family methyltransferase
MGIKQAARILSSVLPVNSLTLVDVGAADCDVSRWSCLEPLLRVVGFEPQSSKFATLEQQPGRRWIQAALGARRETRDFHHTEYWSNCSLLRPNRAITSELTTGDGFEVRKVDQMECQPLDEVLARERIEADYLKVDTQGSELEILQGGQTVVRDQLIAVEVEVEFCELYERQPLFGDVDRFLRESGFVLQDLGNFLHLKPRGFPFVGGPKGRIVSCDALFLKNPRESAEQLMEQGQRKVLAAVTGYLAYGYPELGLVLLQKLKEHQLELPRQQELMAALASIQHAPGFLRCLPGRATLAKCAREAHRLLTRTAHSVWSGHVGNKL